jgi:hypothetical protein
MILHVVLYRPRPDLSDRDKHAFLQALTEARHTVGSIRHFWVGRALSDSPAYLMSVSSEFPFVAIAAFADRVGLLEYLEHPTHAAVSRLFNGTAEAALIFDFDVLDPRDGERGVAEHLLDAR